MSDKRGAPAFRSDLLAHRAAAAFGAAWWGATATMARRLTGHRPARSRADKASSDPSARSSSAGSAATPARFLRQAWREALDKDAAAVASGLYPPRGVEPGGLIRALAASPDVLRDARAVEARRRRGGGIEVQEATPTRGGYPAYYAQNFHFQTGGWFTPESARRYEAQVEMLFAGTAGPMRRRALALLAQAWRGKDQRGLAVLDLACGAGGFLADLEAAFPRSRLIGLDLSAAYLAEAGRRSIGARLVQANAERLPFADQSLDAVSAVYLFHELPPKVRRAVAGEIARTLKPGGLLAFADAVQPADEPRLDRLLDAFPAYFHEPFFASYAAEDLAGLFGEAGLALKSQDRAFLTKAMLFEKPVKPPQVGRKGRADPGPAGES